LFDAFAGGRLEVLQSQVATLQAVVTGFELQQQFIEAEAKWVTVAHRVAAAKAAQQQQQQGGQGEHPGRVRAGRQLVTATTAAHAALLPEFAAVASVLVQVLDIFR
jgi:hypothetical protein